MFPTRPEVRRGPKIAGTRNLVLWQPRAIHLIYNLPIVYKTTAHGYPVMLHSFDGGWGRTKTIRFGADFGIIGTIASENSPPLTGGVGGG